MWIATSIVIANYFITGPISVRLDPFFGLSDALKRGHSRSAHLLLLRELRLLELVSSKLEDRTQMDGIPFSGTDVAEEIEKEKSALRRMARHRHAELNRKSRSIRNRRAVKRNKHPVTDGPPKENSPHTCAQQDAMDSAVPDLVCANIEGFSENCSKFAENARLRVESLCSLKHYQDALVECDKGCGYFNELVERIQVMREAGSLPEHTLDKLETVALCRASDIVKFMDVIKKKTGAELPEDYDPGFRVVKR
jgi:hypothetical protein